MSRLENEKKFHPKFTFEKIKTKVKSKFVILFTDHRINVREIYFIFQPITILVTDEHDIYLKHNSV